MEKSYLSIAIAAITLLTAGHSFAQARQLSTLAAVTRGGQTQMRVIYDIWSSEYPSPVIDLKSTDKKGTTILTAYSSVTDLSEKVSCKIKNGLYHPWSASGRSAKGYITIAAHDIYRVEMKNNVLDLKLSIPQGAILSEVIYLSEGFCSGVILNNENGKNFTTVISLEAFDCSTLADNPIFTKLSLNTETEIEQWIQLKCENGKTAYIRDEALLATPGAKSGEITGFGSVGPAPKN